MSVGCLIIGCGYLGEALAADLLRDGAIVHYTARSAQRLIALRARFGYPGLVFDTLDPSVLPADVAPGIDALDVYCLLTPSALATSAARQRLSDWLARLPVRRAILTSSTGIYGERAGGIVSAESQIQPEGARELRLFEVEQEWLQQSQHAVVRLAGLYGPGRVIGMQRVRDGAELPGQPRAFLNLIHRTDAVSLLRARMRAPHAARIEVGSDGNPITRATYYSHLAMLLGAPVPRFAEPASDVAAGKVVDPGSTLRRLAWRPRFPDFRAGLAAALNGEAGG